MILFTNDEMKMMMNELNLCDEKIMTMFDESVDVLINEENMSVEDAVLLCQEYFLNMYVL